MAGDLLGRCGNTGTKEQENTGTRMTRTRRMNTGLFCFAEWRSVLRSRAIIRVHPSYPYHPCSCIPEFLRSYNNLLR